ncbi:PadR family transcriptional regulator [Streptomyces populi]|uniref:PadR family transcriptional regulator n=1 Tax=Streptomyces populi TaxID=2058924 RepID=A0A2I0SLF6_9ACTN|nr:PadR family transcriptional regulator [Streptomyces populi]PKT70730.1 PadR family transcriptional regulator [Streptomyces populi]
MESPGRITPALLDVLKELVGADAELHGFALSKECGRPTGSIYPILARLEEAGWVASRWEESAIEGRPRKRLYRLSPDGLIAARSLLAERHSTRAARSARRLLPGLRGALGASE